MPDFSAKIATKPIVLQTDVMKLVALHLLILLGLRHPHQKDSAGMRIFLRDTLEEMEAALVSAGCMTVEEIKSIHQNEMSEYAKLGWPIIADGTMGRLIDPNGLTPLRWDRGLRTIIAKWCAAFDIRLPEGEFDVEQLLDQYVFPALARRS
jgi:hypothetical protein